MLSRSFCKNTEKYGLLKNAYLSTGSKKEEKSTAPKIAMFCEKQPDLNAKLLKVHTKKIEFYLSWAVKYHRTEFQLL